MGRNEQGQTSSHGGKKESKRMECLAQVSLDRTSDVPQSVVSLNIIVPLGDMGQNQTLSWAGEGFYLKATDFCTAVHLRKADLGKRKEGFGSLG